MKKYIITGFSGFVAYYFLDYLDKNISINETIEVLGIDINPPADYENNYNFSSLKIHFKAINLMDFDSLNNAIVTFSPDYILHLASFSSVSASWKDPIGSFINNTNIFLNLVEIVRKNNIKCRILSIGSSEEYGNVLHDNTNGLLEEQRVEPLSPYAIARYSQELLSKCYTDSMGLDIVLTRSFNHIGPRQRDIFVIPSFIKQILLQKKSGKSEVELSVGNLNIVRDFLDVRDVVKAYYLLLEKGKRGEIYNVCSGKGNSLKDILKIISEITNVSVVTTVDKERIRPNDNLIIIGNNSKIIKDTGWTIGYSLSETLSDMISYFTNNL